MRHRLSLMTLFAGTTFAGASFAAGTGHPEPWQTGFQTPVTSIARDIQSYDHHLLILITVITIFVVALLGYAIWRFDAKRNPTPARFTHHVMLEVAWTLIPVLILISLVGTSLDLLYRQKDIPQNPDLTVKVIGNQWNWQYMYDVDGEEVYVDSIMLGLGAATYEDAKKIFADEGLPEDRWPTETTWKLEVSDYMVVPVNATVRVQVTASDVIHSWAVPSFGVKVDAVPGRLNETWFKAEQEGTYYGQCSELCGKDHAYMPIRVDVVSQEEYDAYLRRIHDEYAATETNPSIRVASAE